MLAHHVEPANAGQPFGSFIEDIMANPLASVLSSMAALEAHVNEVTFEPVEHFAGQMPELVASTLALNERQPLLERVAFLAVLNGEPKPDLGRNPGQNVAALVDLRNASSMHHPTAPLVHELQE